VSIFRFGVFVFDVRSGELTRDGRTVRLQPQPAQVLAVLLARPKQIVDRETLRRAVWPDDTFVDFDRGLNFCIAQVRGALGDTAATPRYIRTVPKRGYEFICPVEPGGMTSQPGQPPRAPRKRIVALTCAGIAAAAVAVVLLRAARTPARSADLPIVAVARFDNHTGDPAVGPFGEVLVDTLVEQLTSRGAGRFLVVGNAAILQRPREERDLRAIEAALQARYVVLTELHRDGERLRVLAHLIRLPEQTHLQVSRTDGIEDRSLASSDAIASRIAAAFAARLDAVPPSSRPATR
jgi:DNA-binding winged helix-turn-helix (wHTH) protein/TolB-like protein